jgi:hypothetical protein
MSKYEVKAGKPDVDTQSLGHTPGVKSGNSKGNYDKQVGHEHDGKRSARASTGVNPEAHEPIDPRMPNLSPG